MRFFVCGLGLKDIAEFLRNMLTYARLFDVLHKGLKSLRRFPAAREYYKTKEWWNITFDCGVLEQNSLPYIADRFC
jgi:hypothetical protein